MKSSDSNTSLSTDQSKPSQQNVLERVADRSAKKTFFKKKKKKHGCNLCLEKKVIDYKNPEMLSKFTSQNGRILSLKNKQIILKKKKKTYVHLFFFFKLINLKLDPQNTELKEPIKI